MKILSVFFILILFFSCYNGSNFESHENNNEYKDIHSKYLEENNIPIYIANGSIILGSRLNESELNNFINFLLLEFDVIKENLDNVYTTKTSNGNVYKRHRIKINNGKIEIVEDETLGMLRYDPIHPDAYKNGPLVGYVEYPNVDVVLEHVDFIVVNRVFETLIKQSKRQNIKINKNYNKIIYENNKYIDSFYKKYQGK